MAYVVLDLETTGLDPQKDTIIEVGAVRFEDPRALIQPESYEVLQFLINPRQELDPVVTNLTGIKDKDLEEQAIWSEVKPEVQNFLSSPATHFVAHNVDFEYSFLSHHDIDLSTLTLLDTYDLAFMVLPQVKQLGLASLCGSLGIDPGRSHRALDDALATAKLFVLLLHQLQVLPSEMLQQLLAHCPRTGWGFRDICANFAANRELPDLDRNQPITWPLLKASSELDPPLQPTTGYEDGLKELEEIPTERPDWEGKLNQVLAAEESKILIVNSGKGRREAVATTALRWATKSDRRVLLSVPHYRNDLGQHSILEAMELGADNSVPLLANPNRFLDLERLNVWKAGRALDPGETILFGKILHWACSPPPSVLESPHLRHELDRIVWPQLTGQPEQFSNLNPEQPSLVPSLNSRLDSPLTVIDHEALIQGMQELPGFADDFDTIIVDDLWHLAQNLPNFATRTQSLKHVRYFLGQLRITTEGPQDSDAAQWLGSLTGLPEKISVVKTVLLNVEKEIQEFEGHFNALRQREQEESDSRYSHVISKSVHELRGNPLFESLLDDWDSLADCLKQLLAAGEEIIDSVPAIDADEEPVQSRFLVQMQNWLDGIEGFLEVVDEVLNEPNLPLEVRKEAVHWVEIRNQVESCKFNVTQYCGEGFWEDQALSACDSVLFLHVGKGTPKKGGYLSTRLGITNLPQERLDPLVREAERMLIVNPRGTPEPSTREFRNIVEAQLPNFAKQITGNAIFMLGNITQRRTLAASLRKAMAEQPVLILEDEQEDVDTIFRAMAGNGPTIFCCTPRALQTYNWEATNIQCVLAERLPFTQFQDPLLDHQSRYAPRQLNSFYDQTLPICAYNLMRAADLLNGTPVQRLAFILLDSRIVSKRYGEQLRKALPPSRWVHPSIEESPEILGSWLAQTQQHA